MTQFAEPSPSELMRRMDELVQRLETLTTRIEESYVRQDIFKAIVARLEKVEDRFEWLVRLIFGIIVTAVLGLLVVAAK